MDIDEAFREYGEAMVRAMAAFCGDAEAAQDGVSHSFTQALVNREMLEAMPEPAMKAWLYAAARNAITDVKRREVRFIRKTAENDDWDFADPRPDDPAGRLIAESLLEKLPESLRIPVELKYFSNMNAAEIGEAMSIPAATVRTRLRTAMIRLRKI